MGHSKFEQHKANGWAKRGLKMTAIASALFLAGCAVRPEPVTMDEQISQALSDRTQMYADQEPVRGVITLDEALARSLKYNLQQRVALMEQAIEDNLLGIAQLDMLPKLAAQAGMVTRSNVAASSSQSVTTGRQSLEASTSQDMTLRTADLTMSWNVLDFGISYFNAKIQANKSLAAEERRRKVVADITRQVRTTYWEAATAQRLQPEVTQALVKARQSLAFARQTERERLLPPVESLRFQKNMLEMVRQLEVVDSDLVLAKSRLAALMNLPPSSSFTLVSPEQSRLAQVKLPYTLTDLENFAMVKRPEIREETYLARNAVLDTRRSLTRLLPGVSLFAGINGDSNDFLVNRNWASAGVQVSGNLLNVLSWSSVKNAGEAGESLAEVRRQALRMAVLTQVNVAWQEYQQSTQMFERYQELARVQRGILNQTDQSYRNQAATQMEQVQISTETILTTRARDRSFASMQDALGTVYQAAGLDVLPDNINGTSLAALSASIGSTTQQIEKGQLAKVSMQLSTTPVAAAAPVAIAPQVAMTPAVTPAAPLAASQPRLTGHQPVSLPVAAVRPTATTRASQVNRIDDMWNNLESLSGVAE